MKRNFTFQHNSDQKHTSKSRKELLHSNKVSDLEWPNRSPDLNPIVITDLNPIWGDLKRVMYRKCPCSMSNLECFFKEQWEEFAESIFT